MRHHSATVYSRLVRFSPRCSVKIGVHQSMQHLYRLVKYSLIKSRNWIHVMSNVTLQAYMTQYSEFARSSCYQLISEHFGENRTALLQTVAKLRCIELCNFF